MKRVIFVFFIAFVGFLYLNPPDSYEVRVLFKSAINRVNLTINYCLCQDFGHKKYGKMGNVYVAIHITLFFWWFYEVLKADRRRVRRWEKQRQKEIRHQLRLLRLHAWLHNAYPPVPPQYAYVFVPFSQEYNFELGRDAQQPPQEDPGDEVEESVETVPSYSRSRSAFPQFFWRSQSAPP